MKSIIKWMALVAIFATAGKCFMDNFLPEYEAWREKYPPEPDTEDEDEESTNVNVVPASDLFAPDAVAFQNESKEV
jgi:hypothetical protein